MFGQNKKKLKILKLSRDVRYLQKVALKSKGGSALLFESGGRERLYCFPLFAHGQLITTSVTSHSNRSKLSLAWLVLCEEAIDVEQRKDKYWLLLTGYLVICSRCVRFIVYIVCL